LIDPEVAPVNAKAVCRISKPPIPIKEMPRKVMRKEKMNISRPFLGDA
jgi:hypothetical protein